MAKQSKPTNPSSATPPTNPVQAWIERLIATLDPDYPSVFVPGQAAGIDEPAAGYMGPTKPDFVLADDEGWGGPRV